MLINVLELWLARQAPAKAAAGHPMSRAFLLFSTNCLVNVVFFCMTFGRPSMAEMLAPPLHFHSCKSFPEAKAKAAEPAPVDDEETRT